VNESSSEFIGCREQRNCSIRYNSKKFPSEIEDQNFKSGARQRSLTLASKSICECGMAGLLYCLPNQANEFDRHQWKIAHILLFGMGRPLGVQAIPKLRPVHCALGFFAF
jgi:hypothetical protein